jgi:hypothetical protein
MSVGALGCGADSVGSATGAAVGGFVVGAFDGALVGAGVGAEFHTDTPGLFHRPA